MTSPYRTSSTPDPVPPKPSRVADTVPTLPQWTAVEHAEKADVEALRREFASFRDFLLADRARRDRYVQCGVAAFCIVATIVAVWPR